MPQKENKCLTQHLKHKNNIQHRMGRRYEVYYKPQNSTGTNSTNAREIAIRLRSPDEKCFRKKFKHSCEDNIKEVITDSFQWLNSKVINDNDENGGDKDCDNDGNNGDDDDDDNFHNAKKCSKLKHLRINLNDDSSQNNPAVQEINKIENKENNFLEPDETNMTVEMERALLWKARKKLIIFYIKKVLGFLLSTLGLFILLISYTIFGGFIFHTLESPKEMQTQIGVRTSREFHVELLWNVTRKMNILHQKNWSDVAMKIVHNYTTFIYNVTKTSGWNGQDNNVSELQWSFAGSMLYSVTVITTIGYGHIAPKTDAGRVVTIFYAIFGIPLCLLSITHVGGFMATVFRFLYKNIFCGLCCICFKKIKERRESYYETGKSENLNEKRLSNALVTVEDGKGAKWKSCCKLNCLKKDENVEVGKDCPYSPTREALLSDTTSSNLNNTINNVNNNNNNNNSNINNAVTNITRIKTLVTKQRLRQSYKTIVKWRRGIHNALFTDDNKNIQVPIHVSLLMIAGYIALGAVLFGLWESDWNILIGSYFCFITLSTIGFGDFVPGASLDPSSSQEKLVLCTLYLVVGMALLAMCFDLMQEEARCLFRSLGRKLGLVENKSNNKSSKDDIEDSNVSH